MFKRSQFNLLYSRLQEERKFIQVIAGPRQVGKSTLVGQVLQSANIPYHLVAADGVFSGGAAWLDQQWEAARLILKSSGAAEIILAVDEIQKIPNWSESVKANWDADTRNNTKVKVVLLGSSRLLLQQGLTESLMGRYEMIYMGHWSFSEMESAFGLTVQQYAWFGGYPGPVSFLEDEFRWKRYVLDALVDPSISRDILALTRVDKPALLKRLFELGSLYSGQILSYNKMLGQLQDAGNTTTLAHYLQLLDAAGLLAGLEKFAPEVLRQRQSSPKFQVYNTALIAAQTDTRFSEVILQPEKWGRVVESVIGMHLLNHSRQSGFDLFYWREGNDEVDFVIRNGRKVIGIEVKSGYTQHTTGMSVFQKKFNPDKVLLVGSSGLPWETFLKIDPLDI